MSTKQEPRLQHYHFAHYALPGLIFANLEHAVETFSNPHADKLLADLWPLSRPKDSNDPPIIPAGLAVTRRQYPPDVIVFVFSMPQPLFLTEAFLTALACWSHDSKIYFRYFTLELGVSDTGIPRTVVGEWTPERTHLNYGDGPDPDPESFLRKILSFLPRHVA